MCALCFMHHGNYVIIGFDNMPSSDLLKISWLSLSFCYLAKIATIEGEKCQALHTQLFDRDEYKIWRRIVHCMLPYLAVLTHLCTQNMEILYAN